MFKFLLGRKTYLTAIGSLIYAAAGYYTGALDAPAALQIAQVALMGAFLRSGIKAGTGV